MRLLRILSVLFFVVPVGIVNAAKGDTTWLNTSDTLRTYYDFGVCDTSRDPTIGDVGCFDPSQAHCDTGDIGRDKSYINFDYTMHGGYAGFKIDWDNGTSRFDATGYDSIVIYHKGPAAGETVTINFGASATCGAATIFSKIGTFSGSTTWKREAFAIPHGDSGIGLYEMQVLINDASNATATGNFKLGNMFFIKPTIGLVSSAPMHLSPSDGATNQPLKVSFTWGKVSIASSYTVEISTSKEFVTQEFIDGSIQDVSHVIYRKPGLTGTSTAVSGALAAGQIYYWHLNSANAQGSSPWSVGWSFTTSSAAIGANSNIPVLSSPANGATDQSVSANLAWSAIAIATSYDVEVSADPNFGGTPAFSKTGLTSPSVAAAGLAASTTYYWHARAVNTDGASAWSDVASFTTSTPAPAKKSGCGSGFALALIPPFCFKAMSIRKKKSKKQA